MRLKSLALPSSEGFAANRAAHLEALRRIEEAAALVIPTNEELVIAREAARLAAAGTEHSEE